MSVVASECKYFQKCIALYIKKSERMQVPSYFTNYFFQSQIHQILINERCRKRQKRIAFYTIDCKDSCGEIFVDLQNYTYMQVPFSFLW